MGDCGLYKTICFSLRGAQQDIDEWKSHSESAIIVFQVNSWCVNHLGKREQNVVTGE